jgi:3-oxoadipate enol-lactonase
VGEGPAALVGASYGGLVCLDFAARHPECVTDVVLLDAPLPDHHWSQEVVAYAEEEERLIGAGDLDAATELNLSFWAPTVADRLRPMTRWSRSGRTTRRISTSSPIGSCASSRTPSMR